MYAYAYEDFVYDDTIPHDTMKQAFLQALKMRIEVLLISSVAQDDRMIVIGKFSVIV